MYRVYKLTEREEGKITVYRWDGDIGFYDVFESIEEQEAEQARLRRIEEEWRREHAEYFASLNR